MSNCHDIIGKTFSRLTVLDVCELEKGAHQRKYKCQCDCGKIVYVYRSSLLNGRSKSCGNHYKSPTGKDHWNAKHGMSKTRIYFEWASMRRRCNPNDCNYAKGGNKNYALNHITVCDEWQNDFMAFYNWAMENGYTDELTIDRINVYGNYEPSNCRWITKEEQQRNKTTTVKILYNGKPTPLCVLCKENPIIDYRLAIDRYYKLCRKGKTDIKYEDIFYPSRRVAHNRKHPKIYD